MTIQQEVLDIIMQIRASHERAVLARLLADAEAAGVLLEPASLLAHRAAWERFLRAGSWGPATSDPARLFATRSPAAVTASDGKSPINASTA